MGLSDFSTFEYSFDGVARSVYNKGEGPGVVVMHEVPGITPSVADFSRRVVDAGFTVYMPHMFGTPGKPLSNGYALGQIIRACISKEFSVLAKNESSPITDWLRALCRKAHEECGGPGRRRNRYVSHRQLCARFDGRRGGDGAGAEPTVATLWRDGRAPSSVHVFGRSGARDKRASNQRVWRTWDAIYRRSDVSRRPF